MKKIIFSVVCLLVCSCQHIQSQKQVVGVFDSGTGGLTVLETILTYDPQKDGHLDFANEAFVFLGDQANMPYGRYPAEGKTDLLVEHIQKDVSFLLDDVAYQNGKDATPLHRKPKAKAIVIACNTATAYGKKAIEERLHQQGLHVPVIGVIDAGVEGAFTQLNNDLGTIAIFATEGTVASQAYVTTIQAYLKAQDKNPQNVPVVQQGSSGLAEAIDGLPGYIDTQAKAPRPNYLGPVLTTLDKRYGFNLTGILYEGTLENPKNIQINSVENYVAYHVVTLLEKMRAENLKSPLKAVILGCTHYPFVQDIFEKKFTALYDYQENGVYVYRPYLASHIAFVDPAEMTAKKLYQVLEQQKLLAKEKVAFKDEFYISVPNQTYQGTLLDTDGNFTYAYKYGRKTDANAKYVLYVPMNKQTLSSDTFVRLHDRTPKVYQHLQEFMEP